MLFRRQDLDQLAEMLAALCADPRSGLHRSWKKSRGTIRPLSAYSFGRKLKVMRSRPVVSALIDGAAGSVAITAVVGSCFASNRIALDFRAMFAITAAAFFLAGIARGSPQRPRTAWQIVRMTAPGLLGTAALVVNNGLHRLAMPIGLVIIAVFTVAAGLSTRGAFRTNRMRSIALAGGTMVLVAAVTLFVIPRISAYSAFDAEVRPAPSFDLSVDGHALSCRDLRGRVLVLAFWTSWCSSCIQELPHLQRIYEHFRNDPQVAIYAVDVGWYRETPEKGRQFLARHRLALPMAFDSGSGAKAFGIDGVPAIVLIDTQGRTRFRHNGYDMSEDIEASITRHIDALRAGQ